MHQSAWPLPVPYEAILAGELLHAHLQVAPAGLRAAVPCIIDKAAAVHACDVSVLACKLGKLWNCLPQHGPLRVAVTPSHCLSAGLGL